MSNDKIFAMPFAKVFPLLIAKAEKKGRTRAEVYEVTTWLTGYTSEQLDALLEKLEEIKDGYCARDLERQRTEQAVEIGNLLQRIQYETRCEE